MSKKYLRCKSCGGFLSKEPGGNICKSPKCKSDKIYYDSDLRKFVQRKFIGGGT